MTYAELHCRSAFSFLRAASQPGEDRANSSLLCRSASIPSEYKLLSNHHQLWHSLLSPMNFSLYHLTDPRFVWLYVGVLLMLAAITALLWWWRARQTATAIKGARKVITSCEGQKAFAADFYTLKDRIETALKKVPVFASGWKRWSDQLSEFERADGAKVVASETAIGESINLGAWERSLAMQWYRALPNYLVGLGLCFTFIGVVAVISKAALALGASSNDATAQVKALRELLDAASFKFVTSLVGVFASIAYSWFFRWRRIVVEREIAGLVVDFNRRIFILNPAALLRQIREEGQRQTGCLETMATNIGVAVGEQFTEATRIMGEALGRLDETVKSMGSQMGEKTDQMRQAINGLSGGIVETTSKDLANLVQSALKDHLDEVARALNATGKEIDATRLAFSEVATHAGSLRGEYSTLADEIRARTEEISQLLLNAESKVEQNLKDAVTAADAIQTAIRGAAESAAGMDSLGVGLSNAAEAVQGAAKQWSVMGQDFSRLSLANGAASETMKGAVDSLRMQWDTQSSRLGEIDTHLAATITAVQKHFDDYAQRLRAYTAELDTQLGRAVGSFSATIETLGEAPALFLDAGEQLKKAAQDAVAALEPLRELGPLAAALSSSADALRAAVSQATTP